MSVGVFYPASKFSIDNLEQGVKRFAKLTNMEPICPDLPEERIDYAIGNVEERVQSIIQHTEDKNIEFLWAARGGYGAVELLPKLKEQKINFHDKTVIGFSDVTSLHAYISNSGGVSWHAPMVATKGWCEADEQETEAFLKIFNSELPMPLPYKGDLETEGRIVGGNLCTLATLMGTPWQLLLQPGDLLFLEDISEPYYKLVRSLRQLSASPNFSSCTLLWGHITDCSHPYESEEEMLRELMHPYKNKYVYGVNAGHGRPNYPVKLGEKAKLSSSKISM